MNKPQPIETAPTDGTIILTDQGVAMYIDRRFWGSPTKDGWALCDRSGNAYDCADNGTYYLDPEVWVPLPRWMK